MTLTMSPAKIRVALGLWDARKVGVVGPCSAAPSATLNAHHRSQFSLSDLGATCNRIWPPERCKDPSFG
jgi:hypothetical protein